MTSFAHGRPYSSSFDRKSNEPHPRSQNMKFICTSPSGSRFAKMVQGGRAFKQPIALFYQVDGRWLLQTVVDLDAIPDWARNYTQGVATPQ